jgi:threonine synthase
MSDNLDDLKKCSKCGEWKSRSEFHKDKYSKDELRYQCKKCSKEYEKTYKYKEYRQSKKYKESQKKYRQSEKYKEYMKEYNRKYRLTEKGKEIIKKQNMKRSSKYFSENFFIE